MIGTRTMVELACHRNDCGQTRVTIETTAGLGDVDVSMPCPVCFRPMMALDDSPPPRARPLYRLLLAMFAGGVIVGWLLG